MVVPFKFVETCCVVQCMSVSMNVSLCLKRTCPLLLVTMYVCMSSFLYVFLVMIVTHAVQIFCVLTDLSPAMIMDLPVIPYYFSSLFIIILSVVAFFILGLCINLFSKC